MKISYGNSRFETKWKNSEITWEHHDSKEIADPLTKPGIVGTFCRAYCMADAIDAFLSDIYAPSSMENRYDYIPAGSAAGVVIYGDRFAYSIERLYCSNVPLTTYKREKIEKQPYIPYIHPFINI